MNMHYARNYKSPATPHAFFPSLKLYLEVVKTLYGAGQSCARGVYTPENWVQDSYRIGQAMESVGAKIIIEGYEHVQNLDQASVLVSNHMSTLETLLLPGIIQPCLDFTFVIKASLLRYYALGDILRYRESIVLTRTNPRQDLTTVFAEGQKHIANNRSILIFSQGTRYFDVQKEQFSTIGAKLAVKAQVPLIPVALKTDAWEEGKILKDFGTIDPNKTIRFRFGPPIPPSDNAKDMHTQCMSFITNTYEDFIKSE